MVGLQSSANLTCEQALHLEDIVKSRHARGDAKGWGGGSPSRLVSLVQIGEPAPRLC